MTLSALLLMAELTPLKAVQGMTQCLACRGTGGVNAVLTLTEELGPVRETIPCPLCHGEGYTGMAPQWAKRLARDICAAIIANAVFLIAVASHAAVIPVPPGTWQEIQAALDAAQPGDILELEAGAEYRAGADPFELRRSGTSDAWITVRSTRWRDLRPGYRVLPSDTALLPKLCTPATTNQGVLRTDYHSTPTSSSVPIHHWKFHALWFTVCGPNQNNSGDLIILTDTNTETRADLQSHHFVFDQVLITGHSDYDPGPKRGMSINSTDVVVLNSYIGNIKGTVKDGSESHGLGGWIASRVTIRNTRISSGSENFLFGGARAKWAGFTSTDIRLIGSLVEKDLNWNVINWPHPPKMDTFPTCFARPQTVIVQDKMWICNGSGTWFQVRWTPAQPECLSDETGGVHWRDTREWPSKVWDCVNGKWQPGQDILQPIIYPATDIIEGKTTRITQTSKGISNIDYNTGVWVVIAGAPASCPQLNGPHQITAEYNAIVVKVDTSSCGQVPPVGVTMQFQHSNWDVKNMGEFKNNLGAVVRGNVFRNCLFPTWQNQKCRAFLLNLTSEQDGPTSTLSELVFLNNKFYHAAGGIEEGAIYCDGNNVVEAATIIRGNPTQLLDSGCSFIVGDNITVTGAPATGPWAALNGTHAVIDLGSPGFGGDAFIELNSTDFPAPDFNVSVSMALSDFALNRWPHGIIVANNIFKLGHPNVITGGYIGGQQQFSASQTGNYWYSLDIGHMSYTMFPTAYIHNSYMKPEYGMGYSIHAALIPTPPIYYPKPRIINRDNIWEGNFYQGYFSETPCVKAVETHWRTPMFGAGNLSTRPTNVPSGNPPGGYERSGCENQGFLAPNEDIGYEDYFHDNYRLAATSKYKGAATDGSDPGADQNVVDWETETAISGAPNPYLDMAVKAIVPAATGATVEYIAYSTDVCGATASLNRGGSGAQATVQQDGRRGTATFEGLQSGHYWLRLTCGGRYREQEFSTY